MGRNEQLKITDVYVARYQHETFGDKTTYIPCIWNDTKLTRLADDHIMFDKNGSNLKYPNYAYNLFAGRGPNAPISLTEFLLDNTSCRHV